ncbi:FAD-dependent monooxygenase [SAR86 cluster bacterium]|nr:FAD-dependent monooxygenase [SAR86 cluster bacterium]
MHVPIIISGSGVIGNYISLRLKKNNISSIIIEKLSNSSNQVQSIRTVTLNSYSMALLKDMNIEVKNQPVTKISVRDGEGSGAIDFDAKDINEKNLSYVVMFDELKNKLSCHNKENTFFNAEINEINFQEDNNSTEVILIDGKKFTTNIVAACDGRSSRVAKLSLLKSFNSNYEQVAFTFLVKAENYDESIAKQIFSERGIFALMPSPKDNNMTVVWSVKNRDLEKKDYTDYVNENLSYFEKKLNTKLEITSSILNFNLSKHYYKNYVNKTIVLLGDSAHSIHPLAGQGINLGFADADIFCEEIIDNYKKGSNLSEKIALKRYEIRRKSLNLVMLKSMDFFVHLFGNENLYLKLIRNWGLSSVNKNKFLKTFFMKHASGFNKI